MVQDAGLAVDLTLRKGPLAAAGFTLVENVNLKFGLSKTLIWPQCICVHACICVHMSTCVCMCITNQINHIKQTWAIYNPHIHACVYHVCIECMCRVLVLVLVLYMLAFAVIVFVPSPCTSYPQQL